MRERERSLRSGQVGVEERFEEGRRGETVHSGHAEIDAEQRRLRPARGRGPRPAVGALDVVQGSDQRRRHIAGAGESFGMGLAVIAVGALDRARQQRLNFLETRPARRQRQPYVHRRTRVVEPPGELKPHVGGEGDDRCASKRRQQRAPSAAP